MGQRPGVVPKDMNVDELVEQAQSARIEELEEKLAGARNAYYNSRPIVPDEVYDAWVDELRGLRADSPELAVVGATPVSEWVKVSHGIPMGSLDKVNLPSELVEWAQKVGPKETLLVTEKLDGISIHLRYEQGALVQGITRGDGVTGEDITQNVRKMKGVLAEVPGFSGSIRGEVVLLKSDHREHFPEYANPRNAASGLSKRYDGAGSEHLTVIAYQVADGHSFESEKGQFEWLRNQGFQVPWFEVVALTAVEGVWVKYQEHTRDKLDYEIDGLVVRINALDKQFALGEKDGRPKGAVAFKFSPITREATITRIDWQVGGTGRITPVAVFTPVNVLGATITNASVYNIKYITDLGIGVGAKVLIARANDVIPRVMSVLVKGSSVATVPSKCPVCTSDTVMEGEYLICPNTADCSAQAAGRIKRYIAAQDILEWGDVLIEKLVESGKVKTVPDLYILKQNEIAEIDRMSPHMAEKLLGLLWAKNPIPLENLLGALSIPGCASSTIRMVMDAGYDTLDKMRAAGGSDFQRVPGLGPVKSQALTKWFEHHVDQVDRMLERGVKIKEIVKGSLTGKSFCFTGSMTRKRGDLEALVTGAGGVVKSSVGKGLTFLVIADPNSTSSKAQAARKNGTACISEEDFLGMVE